VQKIFHLDFRFMILETTINIFALESGLLINKLWGSRRHLTRSPKEEHLILLACCCMTNWWILESQVTELRWDYTMTYFVINRCSYACSFISSSVFFYIRWLVYTGLWVSGWDQLRELLSHCSKYGLPSQTHFTFRASPLHFSSYLIDIYVMLPSCCRHILIVFT
jgi:hypothetical protein